jgi:hypothetical protein
VLIPDTTYWQHAGALAFAAYFGADVARPEHPALPLSDLEHQQLAVGSSVGLNALKSEVLLRYGLFRRSEWASVRSVGSAGLRIDWAGGPTPDYIGAMLTHPLTGLFGTVSSAFSSLDGTIAITYPSGFLTLNHHRPHLARDVAAAAWARYREVRSGPRTSCRPTASIPAPMAC